MRKRCPQRTGRIDLSLGILLLLFAQCAPFFSMSPATMDATPEQILTGITENMDRLHDLEGKVKVELDASDVHERAVAKILYRRPDWLKIEVKGLLGVTVANIQMKGDTIWVYYPMSNFLVQGRPSAENFELMTGIWLDIEDLRSVILGEGGLARDALDHLVDFGVDGTKYLMTFRWKEELQKHWVDPRRLTVTRSEFYDERGYLELQQTYSDYESFRGVRLPTRIEIVRNEQGHRVVLALQEGKVNRGLSDDRFHLNVPQDVERIELIH